VIKKHIRKILAVTLGTAVATIIFFMIGVIDNALRPISRELMDSATAEFTPDTWNQITAPVASFTKQLVDIFHAMSQHSSAYNHPWSF
tara:strand:- start:108 stop:371 length:264 start_codon:yes stop_codon:yes gene_type:complete